MDRGSVSQLENLGGRGVSRGRMLGRLVIGCGALSLGRTAAGLASASASGSLSAGDRTVLEFALVLEHLQTTFYDQALRSGKLTGEARQFAEVVGGEERAHLSYLRRQLGPGAGKAVSYRFGDALSSDARFVGAAVTLEEVGVAAYNGQAENLSPSALGAVARVISVEARHAAWARGLAGLEPAPVAADVPISAAAAMKAIRPYVA